MMKRLVSIVLILYLVLPINVKAAQITTFGQVLDDLTKAENELKQNQQSINNNKNQLNSDNAKINSLYDEIKQMDEEAKRLENEIEDSNKEIEEKQEQTKDIAVYLQMSGGENTYLEYVFGSETITDLVYRVAVVKQITEYNNKVINDLENLIKANEDRKVVLADTQKKHKEKISNLEVEVKKLKSSISALGDLSPSLEEEVKSKRKIVEYYRSEGCKKRSDRIGLDCATTSANAVFSRPIKNGYVTSFIGYRWGSLHRGIDLGSKTGKSTPLYSIGYGVITSIWNDRYENGRPVGANCINVEYKTTDGTYYTAIYGHLSRYGNVYEGMKVDPNTILGYMGDTGYATGVHLHLELWPCRLLIDSQCKNWTSYVNFVEQKYKQGFRGAESVINFPKSTYVTWTTR